MKSHQSEDHEAFVEKLHRLNPLNTADFDAVRALPLRKRALAAGTAIFSEGEVVSECCLLISGFAFRHKVAKDGGRQIVSYHIPGDLLDIQQVHFDRADHNVQTMTDADVAFIPVGALRELIASRPSVATGLWRDSLIDASIFREWVLNVGRRTAIEGVAHMLCEFVLRCEVAGLEVGRSIALPMTQEHIADATGLTSVHVNRVIRSLREGGFISGIGRHVVIADWEGLCRLADFRPQYLHLSA